MAAVIRILHLADLHLGWVPSAPPGREAERQAERDRLLQRAVDFALRPEAGIGLVVIAGDLFESHRPADSLVAQVLHQLRRLAEARIPVVTVPGNHDELTYHDSVYRSWARDWPGVLVQNPMPERVATLSVRGETVHVYGLAYAGGLTRTSPPLDEFPPAAGPGLHLAVFHGSLDWDVGDRSLPLRGEALARAGYHYVALGHIHRHQAHALGRGLAVYPGAVEAKGFDDPGTGQFTVAVVGPEGARVERHPAPVRPARTVEFDVSAYDSFQEMCEAALQHKDPEAMVRLNLVGSSAFPFDPEALAEALRDGFYHVEVADETSLAADELVARWAEEPTIRGQFLKRVLARAGQAASPEERHLLLVALRKGLAALAGGGRR